MGNKYGDIRYKWLAEKGFNVKSDEHQYEYVQSLFDDVNNVKTVFVNAKAGTGKTTIATLCGIYGVESEEYDQIVYVRNSLSIRDQGFLPGGLGSEEGKEAPYMTPFKQALDNVRPGLFEAWSAEEVQKLITTTTSYLRGTNFKNCFVILDEAQNYNLVEMQTLMTRFHDNCKIVVIGSTSQNDDGENMICGYTPFELYMLHFEEKDYSRNHELFKNYRGDVSQHSDNIGTLIKKLKENN